MARKSKKRGGQEDVRIYEQLSLFDLLCTDVEKSVAGVVEEEEHSTIQRLAGQREDERENGLVGGTDDLSSQRSVEGHRDRESSGQSSFPRESASDTTEGRNGEGNDNGLVTETASNEPRDVEEIRLENHTVVMETSTTFSFTQDEINLFLIHSCNKIDKGRMAITTEFSKDKPLTEMVDIIKSYYQGGYGITTDHPISCWYDKTKGMYLAKGNTAKYSAQAQLISWEDVTSSIQQMLEDGQYVTKIELLSLAKRETNDISSNILRFYNDIEDDVDRSFYFPTLSQLVELSRAEAESNIASVLSDNDYRNIVYDEINHFNDEYKTNKALLRYNHHLDILLQRISELSLERKTFQSSIFTLPSVNAFFTYDEIMADLSTGSNFENSKQRIYDFFIENSNIQERANFLSKEYGIGGHSLNTNTHRYQNHNSKGIDFTKEDCQQVQLSWSEVAKGIAYLIEHNAYLKREEPTTLSIDETSTLPPFDMKYLPKLLTDELGLTKKKEDIVHYFKEHLSSEERAIFLSNCYDDTLIQIYKAPQDLDYIGYKKKENGLQVWEGNYLNQKTLSFLPFTTLQAEVSKLIDIGEYLLPKEAKTPNVQITEEEKQALEELPFDIDDMVASLPQALYTEVVEPKRIQLNASFDERLSVKEKITRNIRAIELLSDLEYNEQEANYEEKQMLQLFTGWGGCPQLFNETDTTFQSERTRLKELLSVEEYQNARAATLTSYYTPIEVIENMYEIVQKLGFENGKILDTSTGTGHFFGAMPEQMYEDSDLYGVELDDVTAKIAHQLYTGTHIVNIGFEKAPFPNNQFDLAISNVPFGNYQVFDREFSQYHFHIHNYFFAKALQKVRNGGLVAFITSTETMDGNSSIMYYINQHADFLGAIRLPNNTFKMNGANTEVSSDIIFLRRNDEKEMDYDASYIQHEVYLGHRKINKYFLENPQMVFGTIEERKNQYGKFELTVRADEKSLQEHFSEVIDSFQPVYEPRVIENENEKVIYHDLDLEHSHYLIDSFFIENDKLYYREESDYYEIKKEAELKNEILHENHITFKTDKDIEKVKQLVLLSQSAVQVVESQTKNIDESIYLNARKLLNERYDNFVKKYGFLNKRTNLSIFQNDSRSYLLNSLEDYDSDKKEVHKSPIFTERTINVKKEIKSVDNVYDGLQCSLDVKGTIDLDYISALYGKSNAEVKDELVQKQYVFIDPISEQLILADDYLSGNVRKKLEVAKTFGNERNIRALEKVMPEPVKAEDITIQLGASWVPSKYVEEFASHIFELTGFSKDWLSIQYDQNVGTWVMYAPIENRLVSSVWGVPTSSNVERYKSQPEFNGYDLFDCILNSKSPTIRNYWEERNEEGVYVKKSEVNVERTTQAQDLIQRLNEEWDDWVFSDVQRRDDLVDKYNELFNSTRLQSYDGSYLTFPEMNISYQLEPYQKNAVARIMNQNTNTLLWQKVGAGKTFEMIAAGMEMKRLGIRNKILYVVPNHLLNQWENEFLKLYPNAHLLVATKRDFAKSRRKIFVNRIATGNYDAIIMPHSSFGMISVSQEKQIAFEQEELDNLKRAIDEIRNSDAKGKTKRIKVLERTIKSIEKNIKTLTDNVRDNNAIPFENLGIDFMFVDESHEFKNLYTYTSMQNIVGLQTASSKKAQDMFMKTKIIQENGGRICFATGTPVTNTMAELYTLQRYLQPDRLKDMQINCFDAWAKAFGKAVSSFEISIDGSQFINRQRFSKFFNVQELMTSVREFAEIQTANMLRHELLKSTTRSEISVPPTHIGGKPQIIRIEPSEDLENYISDMVERSDRVHTHQVNPSVDNMLKITTDSKKASIDLRLIDPSYPDDPNGKLSVIAKKVYEVYQEGNDNKATQLIFCDSSTPKRNVPDGEFSDVYNEIKRKLILLGIPEHEIAFIHDYDTELKKQKLFKQMNDGDMRVLFGSTAKLGAGTNVQKRILAIHHVDVPWKASDIEQQNGRAFRQGNMYKEIYEFRYVTEKSFDAYSWQIVQTKSTYDEQLLEGADGLREFEESQKSSFEYAEIKAIASGNPIVKEKFEVDNEVRRLENLKKQWRRGKLQAQEDLIKLPISIEEQEKNIAILQQEHSFLKPRVYNVDEIEANFSFKSATGKIYTSMKEAWQDVTEQMKNMLTRDRKVVGQIVDCNVIIKKNELPIVEVEIPNSRTLVIDEYHSVGRVNFVRILKRLNGICENFIKNVQDLEILKKNLVTVNATISQGFVHEETLRNLRNRQNEINRILNGKDKTEVIANEDLDKEMEEREV